ncbi:FtsX-like permease family protein [Candidatus Uabimicrobium sp. HlEnr_7]|uniref:FtsX-like permease family protein n=1 Tax=Candidatus Uabimicrobium helgolandensis TaxID=3095367 RepID=UPI003556E894
MLHPLAVMNIVHNKSRSLSSIVGISFVIMIIFYQMGAYSKVISASMQVYNELEFDIIVLSNDYFHMGQSFTFPRQRLYQISDISGVETAVPFYIALSPWRNSLNGIIRPILVMAMPINNQGSQVFSSNEIRESLPLIIQPNTLLFDRRSRKFYGPQTPGTTAEIAGNEFKILGNYTMGGAFISTGTTIVSDQNFQRIFFRSLDNVSFGLIRLKNSAHADVVAEKMRQILEEDVLVLTRTELEQREKSYWATTSSVGLLLGSGVIVVFLVGIVILSQVLATQVMNHITEYATLKAFGYSSLHLANIVLQQAFAFVIISYVIGFGLAVGFYKLTSMLAGVPIGMTTYRAIAVALMTIFMGTTASITSLRKVLLADPADVF